MSSKSKNKFDLVGEEIHITRDEWSCTGLTTYREDYYDEIASKTWTLNQKGYLLNGKLGFLHQYIVSKWYGDDVLKEMTEKGYVVDHMNNNHADCRISNLEFLKKGYNTAKGQSFDIDSKAMQRHIAVNIFKDFSTGCYQITIACNDYLVLTDGDGKKYPIVGIKLLYDCNYSIVIIDAENILRIYETEGKIYIKKTHSCDFRIIKAPEIELTEEEKKGVAVIRDGITYPIFGTGKQFINAIHFDEGWLPPNKEQKPPHH